MFHVLDLFRNFHVNRMYLSQRYLIHYFTFNSYSVTHQKVKTRFPPTLKIKVLLDSKYSKTAGWMSDVQRTAS